MRLVLLLMVDRRAFGRGLAILLTNDRGRRSWLARELGVTPSAVGQWIAGESEPEREKVFKLETLLGCAPGTLSSMLGYRPLEGEVLGIEPVIADIWRRLTDDQQEAIAVLGRTMAAPAEPTKAAKAPKRAKKSG